MRLGLGTGTTSALFIELLGERVRTGLRVTAIATSIHSHERAAALGIPLVDSLQEPLDLAVDGADEIDPQRNLLKGGGGALFREKLANAPPRELADDLLPQPRDRSTWFFLAAAGLLFVGWARER